MNAIYQASAIFIAVLGFGFLIAPFLGAWIKGSRERHLPYSGDRP